MKSKFYVHTNFMLINVSFDLHSQIFMSIIWYQLFFGEVN